MRTLQLYGTAAATASAVAQVTIPSAGRLRGIQFAITCDATADNSRVDLELSKVPSSQIATNGAQDPFFHTTWFKDGGDAAGTTTGNLNAFFPVDVPVRQGEIIYLHALVTTTTFYAHFILFYD